MKSIVIEFHKFYWPGACRKKGCAGFVFFFVSVLFSTESLLERLTEEKRARLNSIFDGTFLEIPVIPDTSGHPGQVTTADSAKVSK